MIEPGSARERVHQEANKLIAAIRDVAMRIIREHRGLCPDHGIEMVRLSVGAFGCPRKGCGHVRSLLGQAQA